jgi:hypothetical protein
MTHWAAMVIRKIYVNARRPQSKRNRAGAVRPVDRHVGWLAAGCSRLDTTSKKVIPGNIRVIVVGSGVGELVRTPEMVYKAKLLPSPNWSEAIQFEEASAAKPYPEQHVPNRRHARGGAYI